MAMMFKTYSAKIGFDFVSPAEELRKGLLRGSFGTFGTFLEIKGFQAIIDSRNIDVAIGFLGERVDMVFHMLDWMMIYWFSEVSNLLAGYARTLNLIRSMAGKGSLEILLMNRFEKLDNKTRAQLRKRPDLLSALDHLKSKISAIAPAMSYPTYVQDMTTALVEAVNLLNSDFVMLDEVDELALVAPEYARQIEMGLPGSTPRFGSAKDYLETCDRIFQREDIYPETRIIANRSSSRVLESFILKNHDYLAYLKFVKRVKDEANLLEQAIQVIRKKNPKSQVAFLDTALSLMAAHSFARMNEESDESRRLWEAGWAYIEKHHIEALKPQVYWKNFLETNDYDFLRKIEKLHLTLSHKEMLGFQEKNLFIGQMAMALLDASNAFKALDKAEEYLGMDVPPDSVVDIVFDQYSLEVSLYLSRMLRALFSCLNGIDDAKLQSLQLATKAMDSEVSQISETRSLILKTHILLGVIKDDRPLVERSASKMVEFTEPASPIWLFVDSATRWVQAPTERRGLKFYQLLDDRLDYQDPWSRILSNYMKDSVKKELRPEDIQNYDTVVFVEGKIDARVYPILAGLVGLKRLPLFIDVEGWTVMEYYTNARIATKFGKRITVLFDGDTNSSKNVAVKKNLIDRLRVPKDRIVTLPKTAIEDYLLNPAAILRAFPKISLSETGIKSVLASFERKRNKKNVLNLILKKYANTKFDEQAAMLIAKSTLPEEISSEMKKILLTLT